MDIPSIPECLKQCTKCQTPFPRSPNYFYRQATQADGLGHICKTCFRQYNPKNRVRYHAKKEENKSKRRRYRQRNKDEINRRARQKRAANPQIYRAYSQKTYQKNKLADNTRCRVYKKLHPEKCRLLAQKRAARQRDLPCSFTKNDWEYACNYWHFSCAICENENGFLWTIAMDHWIPLASPQCTGTIPTNMLPLCHGEGGCNNSKQHKNPEAWVRQKLGLRKAKSKLVEIATYFALVQVHSERKMLEGEA